MVTLEPHDPMKPEWVGSISGLVVYAVEGMPKGVVRFFDDNGKLLGEIHNVRQAHVGQKYEP